MRVPETPATQAVPIRPFSGRVVIVGAGTGGPQALTRMLSEFPPDFAGVIIVVQHMRPGFTRVLAEILSYNGKLPVYEPLDGQPLQPSRVLLAPSGSTLTLTGGTREGEPVSIALQDTRDDAEQHRNRISVTMASAARIFGQAAVGVLLTGVGDDGREGMRAILEAGGTTFAQDEESSAVHDMPRAAIEAGVVSEELPLWSIGPRVLEVVMGGANAAAA